MSTKIKNIVVCVLMAATLLVLTALCFILPKPDFLDAERREPAAFPDPTLENIMKDGVEYNDSFMSKFEKYAIDAFPFRNEFRTLKAIFVNCVLLQKDNNDIYFVNGQTSKLDYPLKDDMTQFAVDKFHEIFDLYLKDKTDNIYLSIIPDKNYFLAEQNGYPAIDFDKLVNDITSGAEFAEYIDIFDSLTVNDYYKTDTHWKQENLGKVVDKLLGAMTGGKMGEYKENTLKNPFYGVYYGQSALPLPPDTIKYLTNGTVDNLKVTVADSITGMPVKSTVYNMDKAFGKDPYEMFLSGATPIVVMENPNAKTDKELIIFRDSFGSSISPLLTEEYAKVTLLDIRYVQTNMLGNLAKVYGYNFENADVLFLYSTLILNTAKIFK